VLEPEVDGDVAEPLPDDGDDVEPVDPDDGDVGDVALPDPDVVGDADGVVEPRSLVLPDGPWLQAVASMAISEKAKTPPSNFFMNAPPGVFRTVSATASAVPLNRREGRA